MISRAALAVSSAIQRLSVSLSRCGIEIRHQRAQPFISAKRAAFQSLVAKLR